MSIRGVVLGIVVLGLSTSAVAAAHSSGPPAPPGASAALATAAGACAAPTGLPATRSEGGLTVTSPSPQKKAGGHRLRSHAHPKLNAGVLTHEWVGIEVPAFVPLSVGAKTLEILDETGGGYLALYRDVSYAKCGLPDGKGIWKNCASEVRLYDCAGQELAAVALDPLLSRRDQLEVQDVRYADGTLYFNEGCMTYSREAGGRCSSLVALDPFQKKILWRTPPLVSNNAFLVVGDYIVTAYGFTSEPSSVRVVRRRDGAIMDRKALPSSADDDISVRGEKVSLNLYNMLGRVELTMVGFDGATPRLVPAARPAVRP